MRPKAYLVPELAAQLVGGMLDEHADLCRHETPGGMDDVDRNGWQIIVGEHRLEPPGLQLRLDLIGHKERESEPGSGGLGRSICRVDDQPWLDGDPVDALGPLEGPVVRHRRDCHAADGIMPA